VGVAAGMRALQAGSLQAYLIYIFITLLLLLILRYESRRFIHRLQTALLLLLRR